MMKKTNPMNRRQFVIRAKFAILVLLILLLSGIVLLKIRSSYTSEEYSKDYVSIEEVKSELSFLVYTKEEWNTFFAEFQKDYLTEKMLAALLEKTGVSEYIIDDTKTAGNQAVSRSDWIEIYQQMLDYLDTEQQVEKKTILVLGTMEAEVENAVFSNQGDLYTILPHTYFEQWNAYEVYCIEEKLIGIAGVSEETCTVSNAYLKASTQESVAFLFHGGEYEVSVEGISVEVENGVCDLVFSNGKLDTILQKQDYIEGKLLSYDDTYIEIEGYGKIKHMGRIPVYTTLGEAVEKSISDVVLGNMEVSYIVGQEEVCAILIKNEALIEDIRVLLLADDGTKFRGNVWMKSDVDATLQCGDKIETIPADTVVCAGDYVQDVSVTFSLTPETEEGRVYLCNEAGEMVSNGYYGSMEARWYPEGYAVVNRVPFEKYLYAVVPSEMPSSYAPEALKAQAVCARSYAYIQLIRADLAAYGAHINDSTSYQVYNKQPQTEASIAAVDATSGMVMTYQGEIIEAYYYSTSMGYTDTAAVWNAADDPSYGYLKSVCLGQSAYEGDLSTEDGFKEFLHIDFPAYDSDIRFFRWQVNADFSGQTDTICSILENRRSVSDKNVIYYETDGKTIQDSCDDFGELKDISVKERSSAGTILTLQLTFSNGIAEVKSEYNIRKILGCGMTELVFRDGSKRDDMTILPSACCTVEKQEDGTYLLDGGGYGHGLGMSQNAANGMAKAGYDYVGILNYFYNDIKIEDMNGNP